jgi:hypothetical protein
VPYDLWGSGDVAPDLPRRTELRPLGEGGALAIVDGRLIRARSVTDLRAVIDVLRGDAPGLTDVQVVPAAVEHNTPRTATWYMSAPDEHGIVAAGRTPALVDDPAYLYAPLPAGLTAEAATTRVGDDLAQAGFETATVSEADGALVVAIALGDGDLMRRALDTVPDIITASLAER